MGYFFQCCTKCSLKLAEERWHRLLVTIEIIFLKVTYLNPTHLIFFVAVIFFTVALARNTKETTINKYRVQDSLKDVLTLCRCCARKNTQNEYWFAVCVVCAFQKKFAFLYSKYSLCFTDNNCFWSCIFLQDCEESSVF